LYIRRQIVGEYMYYSIKYKVKKGREKSFRRGEDRYSASQNVSNVW
jgi:hypothetical protein